MAPLRSIDRLRTLAQYLEVVGWRATLPPGRPEVAENAGSAGTVGLCKSGRLKPDIR